MKKKAQRPLPRPDNGDALDCRQHRCISHRLEPGLAGRHHLDTRHRHRLGNRSIIVDRFTRGQWLWEEIWKTRRSARRAGLDRDWDQDCGVTLGGITILTEENITQNEDHPKSPTCKIDPIVAQPRPAAELGRPCTAAMRRITLGLFLAGRTVIYGLHGRAQK